MKKLGLFILSFILFINYLVITPFAEIKTVNSNSLAEEGEITNVDIPIESKENDEILGRDTILDFDEEVLSKRYSKVEIERNDIKVEGDVANGVCGTSSWRIDTEKVLHIGEGEFSESATGMYPWYNEQGKFNKIIFEGKVLAAPNSKYLFAYLSKVEEIENLHYLDTSCVTNMGSMFSQMSSVKKLDVSHFNTSNVEDMSYMFENTRSLTSLDISNFDTSNVTNMKGLFSKSTNMSELKLGNKFKFVGDNKAVQIPIIDATTPFGYTGKWVNVGEGTVDAPLGQKQWTSDELVDKYNETDADTYVWEKFGELEVETKKAEVLLGSNLSDINYKEFIKSVKLGNRELNDNEYTVELEKDFSTSIIGDKQLKLAVKVILPDTGGQYKEVSVDATSSIIWGSTLVIKNDGLWGLNASVSLLHNQKNEPYLNANQGSGLTNTTITSRPEIRVFRNNESENIFTASYGTVGNTPSVLVGKWNTIFESSDLQYGDVLVGHVNKFNGGANWKGNNTFISRNNTLITETVGYDYAYYELTPSGYRLLRLNQLVVNNNQKVKINTNKEEMNKNISNYISIPEHIENPNDFRMEFESVDTTSSGNKKSTINVYETLESGGEFKTTYEVAYTVNPEVTESYYDVNGKQIEQNQTTEFEYGKEFTPSPEKYIENKGELYIYRGWVDALPGTENIVPQEGVPEATKVEKNYYYIYDKADKFINVTLPTEMVFGTFENNKKISSKKYEIKNNSDELPIEVSLEQFDKVKSDIKLLSSNTPDPTQEEASAKLNLCVDNERVIPGLTEATPTQVITKIDTNASRAISLEGTYFGNMNDKNILDYKMHLKFKATQDNKN